MKINENPIVDAIWKQVSKGMAPVARQVGCLFSEIFATFFGIKSLNNLLFNKFKCKMARAASYRGREQHSSCTNSKYNKQDFFPVPFFFFKVEPGIGSVSTTVTRIMHMWCGKVAGSDGMEDRSQATGHLCYIASTHRLIWCQTVKLSHIIKFSLVIKTPIRLERSKTS